MTSRSLRLALIILLAAAPLAACGKKGQPSIPAGEVSTYPHPYPTGATEQNSTPSVPTGQPDENETPPPTTPIPPNAKPNP